jgi:hypothetical protein
MTKTKSSTKIIRKSKSKSKAKAITYIFTKEEYNNDNGVLTSVWGPSLWHSLHCISINYPVNPLREDKINYKRFIMSLRYILPCGKCRENITTNLQKLPLTFTALKNRENFSKWMYQLHEIVNKALGKRSGLTFRDVQDRYEHFRARCGHLLPEPTRTSRTSRTRKNVVKKGSAKEGGCVNSIYGVKSKCQLHIVPQSAKGCSLMIDSKCVGKGPS